MTRYLCVLCVSALLVFSAGAAMADGINGRFGVTGRMGFAVPTSDSSVATGVVGTNTGFIGGGGFIYGLTETVAAELDITHASLGDFNITNISLGGQYRFLNLPIPELVPYGGIGLDILLNGVDNGGVDDVLGMHLSAGADYFIQKQLALTGEAKLVLAPNADIHGSSNSFNPNYFSMTFGVRYFFN